MRTHTPHRGFTLFQVVLVLASLVLLAALLLPLFGRARDGGGPYPSCQKNLKQIGLGFKQYIQDYDEKYPPIAVNAQDDLSQNVVSPFGWADALQPYLKSTEIFQCQEEPNGPNSDPRKTGYIDYWFNAHMAGASESSLDAQALTVANGDGDPNDARYHLWRIPRDWRGNSKSPLYRHLDGANLAFADGHARWVKAAKWKGRMDSPLGYTFRLQPLDQEVSR